MGLVILAAGCGDPTAKSTSRVYEVQASTTMTAAKPPIAKRQFVKRVNAICRAAWDRVKENWDSYLESAGRGLSAPRRYAEAVRGPLITGLDFHVFDSIRILGSPPGDEEVIEAFIGPFQAAVELGQIERWTAHSPVEIIPHFVAYNRGARRYGLNSCLVDETHLRPFTA